MLKQIALAASMLVLAACAHDAPPAGDAHGGHDAAGPAAQPAPEPASAMAQIIDTSGALIGMVLISFWAARKPLLHSLRQALGLQFTGVMFEDGEQASGIDHVAEGVHVADVENELLACGC